ncbi:BDH_1b_G0000940.mRNA.1.CDS.1 [Saccharomyces cerevisiae]|nr:AEH_G0000030.mRNA.1.CDS.1 [Saccharomyces cerevisiae]CAI4241561.1 BDC_1c_G0000940.mRNA.1.CDS.1 [Saccharomyces cerevisiae]CAI4243514.1 BDF_1d_G0000910.mRNA.1.CDS.1 [Saccharomyces cerevisiae]CAI4247800.1 BDH_1b_G0000940.mRNA.1.CDS.1 [Saccharomyces cerevisiae]CAI6465665.1 AEH_G0000030.mRNA.1.CDS.1 [Saccharomyces cerevisiae]
MIKSAVYSILAASLVNAGTIPLGKLSDIDKIGTQKEIFPFLGGSGPYYSFPGDYGISRDLPESCEMKQVQMVGRHGERYPTVNKAKSIMTTWYKLSNYTGEFNGALSFLNDDYEFFIRDRNNLEMETTLANSVDVLNPYTGEMNAKRHARDFLAQYGYMVKNQTSFAVFTSNSNRCHDTAQYFIDGLGDQFNISLQTISEAESAGANTLSAHHSCPAWDDDVNDDILKKYDTKYLSGIAKRLNKENKGLNLTSSDANTFFAWCAYEINARGYSDICNIFTKDELVRFSYGQDLETYYQTGPGYDVVRSVGANLFNASVKLLKESEVQDQKVWLSFTHDTDILNYLTTIGIIDDKNNLTAEHVPFMDNTFHRSWYVPQGARVYTEKFQCSNDTYVRYVINDAVVPIETCSTGPGFSCEINDFYDYAEKRVAGTDFLKVCNVSSVSNSTELTFFWDWNTKHYNDTLLKQ